MSVYCIYACAIVWSMMTILFLRMVQITSFVNCWLKTFLLIRRGEQKQDYLICSYCSFVLSVHDRSNHVTNSDSEYADVIESHGWLWQESPCSRIYCDSSSSQTCLILFLTRVKIIRLRIEFWWWWWWWWWSKLIQTKMLTSRLW